MAEIRAALKNARLYLIAPVFFILIGSHYIRALRWRLLMETMGYTPDKANTFFAVMIGYLANQAFPRLGEVLKCTLLARYEKIPADKLVGTIILERLIDAICLVIVFAITLLIQPGLYTQIITTVFKSNGAGQTASLPGYIIAIIVLAAIAIIIGLWMFFKKKKIRDVKMAITKIGSRIWLGLATIRHLKKEVVFFCLH